MLRECKVGVRRGHRQLRCSTLNPMRSHGKDLTGEIKAEIRKPMELLVANRELLATLVSWHDTLDEAEIS